MAKLLALATFLAVGLVLTNVSGAIPPPEPNEPQFDQIYVGADGSLVVTAKYGLYRSVDRGQDWREVLTRPIRDLIVQDHGLYALDFDGGRYRSTDIGESWKKDGEIDERFRRRGIPRERGEWVAIGNSLYFCIDGTLLISSDVGSTWRRLPLDAHCRSVIGNRQMIYVLTDDLLSLWKSRDGGRNWLRVQQAFPASETASGIVNPKLGPNGLLYAHFLEARGNYVSRDEGATWQPENFGLSDANELGVLMVRDDAVYIRASWGWEIQKGAFYRSVDGKTATKMNLEGLWYNDVQTGADGTIYVATLHWIYRSLDQGKSWMRLDRKGVSPYRTYVPKRQ